MKIGIDCRNMFDPQNEKGGGVERYIFMLVTELILSEHEFVLFLHDGYQSEDIFHAHKNVTISHVEKTSPSFLGNHFLFARHIDKLRVDIFYSPVTSLPLNLRTKAIVTVHDLAIYMHPEWFPGGQWFSKHVLVPRALKKAKRIISVSKKSKEDCMTLFGVESQKISVVHNILPSKKYFYKQPVKKLRLPKKFILFIGTLEPRKNLERAFHAFIGLKRNAKHADVSFVVLGNVGWKTEDVFGSYSKKELEEIGVVFLERITEHEKWIVIERAEVLFFPSLYEGFGLPILEALTAKKRVITSKKGAIEEVGQDNVVYVDPYDISEMIDALEAALKDDSFFDPDVRQFSSKIFREKMLAAFEETY